MYQNFHFYNGPLQSNCRQMVVQMPNRNKQPTCFQCGSLPLLSDIKGMELPPANILIPLERQLIALQLCRWQFLYNETLQQTFRPLLSKLSERRQV